MISLKDKLLHSQNGKNLFNWITDIYDNCKIMVEIYESLGIQFDNLDFMFDDISKQMFPQTATWGIKIWEERLGLIINEDETIEKRRGKIIAKLQSRVTVNPETMATITQSFTGAEIEIIEWIEEYTFKVLADIEHMNVAKEINQIIKKIKPSHMAFLVQFILLQNYHFYIGAVTTIGSINTLLPYNLEPINLEAHANAFNALTHISQAIVIE